MATENSNTLSPERLKQLLDYNPATGIFTRKVARGGTARAGTVAGCPNSEGYLRITIDGRSYRAHRLAWLYSHGRWPKDQLDHLNGQRDDNRLGNLREVDPLTQQRNAGIRHDNKSGCPGVYWREDYQKWVAEIRYEGVKYYLGLFDSYEEAVLVRKGAEIIFGFHANHGTRPSWGVAA